MKRNKVLRIVLIVLALFFLVIIGYVFYVFISYHRIEDMQNLTVWEPKSGTSMESVSTETEYEILTYNIGFGAYTPEYSFFMDGGTYSRAMSKESVIETTNGAVALVKGMDPDFILFQEVDLNSTRSYHVNQNDKIIDALPDYNYTFSINYDSPYLFYPILEPHGKSNSGLAVYSKYNISSAIRRSFPISTSFSKFLDLDRCFSINRIPVENGKELVVMNLHMSAYGNDDTIRAEQVSLLCKVMETEVKAGNYVICGGDFNHDLLATDNGVSEAESWAFPFPRNQLPEGTQFAMDQLTVEEKEALVHSTRNADIPYNPDKSYTVMVDGFIISDNIKMYEYETVSTGYQYSDHEPVRMVFSLEK